MAEQCCTQRLDSWLKLVHHSKSSILAFCVPHFTFSLVATLGNLLVIRVLIKASTIPANVKKLFLSLAFSDLAVLGLLLQLMKAIIYAVVWKMASRGDNLASLCPTVLSVYSYFGYLLIAASFLNVTVIAGDRLLAVSLHLWYHELVTPKRVTTVVSVWIISCVLKILFIFFPNEIQMVAAVICLTGYVITTMTYVRIYKAVKYHQNQIYGQNQLQNPRPKQGRYTDKGSPPTIVYLSR